jgi:hypothetical protein
MSECARVLLWVSTLQADILALALELERRRDIELLIATDGLPAWRAQPIALVRPLRSPILERGESATRDAVVRFKADVVVCDNHFPEFPAAPRVVHLWHGLGWKATPPGDITTRLGHIRRLSGGDPRQRNPNFLAQCYHERDKAWRVESWGVAPENCRVVGSCFSDLLIAPPYTRQDLAPRYRIPIGRRPTLLVSFTWHYGRIFPGSWQPKLFGRSPMETDLAFLGQVAARASDYGASILLCLHDRWRYEKAYLEALHREAARFQHIEIKHKNEHPDNLADLVVADAMISNLSSFITYFYHFGRPTVHLAPRPGEAMTVGRMKSGALKAVTTEPDELWMNDPEDNGGLTAHDADEALAAISTALTEPESCVVRAKAWLEAHVLPADGKRSKALADEIVQLTKNEYR